MPPAIVGAVPPSSDIVIVKFTSRRGGINLRFIVLRIVGHTSVVERWFSDIADFAK